MCFFLHHGTRGSEACVAFLFCSLFFFSASSQCTCMQGPRSEPLFWLLGCWCVGLLGCWVCLLALSSPVAVKKKGDLEELAFRRAVPPPLQHVHAQGLRKKCCGACEARVAMGGEEREVKERETTEKLVGRNTASKVSFLLPLPSCLVVWECWTKMDLGGL